MKTLTELLPQLTVGDPDVSGQLAVFPIFGPEPRLEYVSYAEGASRGVTAHELENADINELCVINPLDVPALLFEGEELKGAQQNRTVDAAVLVAAGARLGVTVSCVEAGRWDGTRHAEPFAPSQQTASPGLRSAKARVMREHLAGGAAAHADQQEVWSIVGPDAMSNAYDLARDALDALVSTVTRREGQTGALVAIGGRFAVLDQVSRPDVFAALFAPLVQGYAFDALEAAPTAPPSTDEANEWLGAVTRSAVTFTPAVGLGERVYFTTTRSGGTGLAVDGELIQLSVYAEVQDGPRGRIRRPSRRH